MLRSLARVAVVAAVLLACSSDSGAGDGSASVQSDIGKACSTNAECGSGICIPKIGENIGPTTKGVCTIECSSSDACVKGWQCIADGERDVCQCQAGVEVCDGQDNDCNGVVDDDALGRCHCDKGKTACESGCFDLATDPKHCGSCARECPPEAGCERAACTCPNGQTACDKTCVDVSSDPLNCGSCGFLCGPGTSCVEGRCHCGTTNAGDECMTVPDPASSSRNFCSPGDVCRKSEIMSGNIIGTLLGSSDGVMLASKSVMSSSYGRDFTIFPRSGKAFGCAGANIPAMAAGFGNFVAKSDIALSLCSETGPAELYFPTGGALVYVDVLAVGPAHVYWVSKDINAPILRCPLTGCGNTAETFAALPAGAYRLRATADALYAQFGPVIGKFALSNAAYSEVGTFTEIADFAVRDDTLYVASSTGIVTCPTSGCGAGPTSWVAQPYVSSIYPDASRVYWRSSVDVYSCAKGATCSQSRHELTGLGTREFVADDSYLWIGPATPLPLERIAK